MPVKQTFRKVVLALVVLVAPILPQSVMASVESYAVFEITVLIDKRTSLMPQVAAWKYINQTPVRDAEREQVLLESVAKRARELGLEPESVKHFMRQIFGVSVGVQEAKFREWRARGQPRPPEKTLEQLRDEIATLTDAIVEKMYLALPMMSTSDGPPVAFEFLSGLNSLAVHFSHDRLAEFAMLFGSLRGLSFEEVPLLDRIKAAGVLRVGTTGDYQPFSYWTDNSYSQSPNQCRDQRARVRDGIDLQLALELSLALGVRMVCVRTTWEGLEQDLQLGRYDIGMSGITITDERRQFGTFSYPHHTGGKRPIALCSRKDDFASLADIDKPSHRVLTNKGGTNEDFVRANIKHAEVYVFHDNNSIFGLLERGVADVMITDAIEVKMQAYLRPELCATSAPLLTNSQKGFYMPSDEAFKNRVDRWLRSFRKVGKLSQVFKTYLAGESAEVSSD